MHVWFYMAIYMESGATRYFYLMKSSDNVTNKKLQIKVHSKR